MTINEGLEIGKSLIPDAGWGLFATKDFKTGDKLTRYDGYNLPYHEIHEGDAISQKIDIDEDIYNILTHQDYILEENEGGCIYGYKKEYLDRHPDAGWGSMINDRFTVKEWTEESAKKYIEDRGGKGIISGDIYNCMTRKYDVIALRDIRVGEELYCHYGISFWLKKLNDDRYNEGFKWCKCANGKTFRDYVEVKYRNFDLRDGLNYTPNLLE